MNEVWVRIHAREKARAAYQQLEAGWAEELLTALASPGLAWLLLLIGGAGLYIELKTPGFGFGGLLIAVDEMLKGFSLRAFSATTPQPGSNAS